MNTQIQDIKKALRFITIILIGATLLTPFIFSGELFFPYITSKAFFMRLMIVLSTASYIGLALIDKNSRPKKSLMLYAMGGFMVVLLLATLNSVNPTRSFWSNFERMEGLVTMLYMAVLFVISASTLRKKEWTYMIHFSLLVSVFTGLHALGGKDPRISGQLGNSSYLGVYALIHAFFGLLAAAMVFRGNRERELLEAGEHQPAKRLNGSNYTAIALYIAVAVFNLFILYKTGTRGAFVGLVIGLVLSSIYLAWKEKNKFIRFSAMTFLVLVMGSVAFLGIFKHASFVENNPLLARFAALVTFDLRSLLNNQGQSRTMIWKMAFEGVKEKPLLGWGQDNFGYVFAKHYNPHMYAQEQWFDRSHNVFMDWLIAAGVLGLVGYLSLFGIALYFIFSKESKFTIIEKSIWLGLLASYFIHNIFVFDNLSSYVLFFLILGYINDRHTHDRHEKPYAEPLSENQVNNIILISILSLLALSYVSYQTILKPYTQNIELIGILRGTQTKGISATIDKDFENVLQINPTGKFEAFEQLAGFLPKVAADTRTSTTTKQNMFMLYKKIVDAYDKEISDDARYNYFVSNTYRAIGLSAPALAYITKAYDLSPTKQTFAYSKAIVLMDDDDVIGAVALLKKAYEDAPENITAYGYYVGTLAEAAKRSNYAATDVDKIAEVLIVGYRRDHYDLIIKKEFWNLFADQKVKAVLVQKLGAAIPEKKVEIVNAAK
ncbi:O-antigen ligase family protein [Candidatus Parcubacteria bacterium]|nr:O-antigen ligase family protein [Candidatus Parcubacteria bacterium]